MYKKLLISSGGGIISIDQQGEQDNCATIAIGLGGTGISCLRLLKREIYTRVKPDNGESLIPEYKHIKFLALDTDKNSIAGSDSIDSLDAGKEFFDISCQNIESLLKEAHLLKQDPKLRWLKSESQQGNGDGIRILSAEAGAGGVRQIGRLLLMQNCQSFVDKLKTLINDARRDLHEPQINIHIFTGMSGGTGAGTFLDVCYIVQHVLEEIGIAGRALTCGYFFLPDINIDHHSLPYLEANGFACMKELDYCMNFENNGGEWNQRYDGFSIKTNDPPVKLAHIITAVDGKGNTRQNGYDYAMHVVVDYVMEYIIKPSNEEIDEQTGLKSHLANVERSKSDMSRPFGGCYNYCVLGAANAYMPYKEINTYLASKIFEGFSGIENRIPSDENLEAFIQAYELRYEDIRRQLENNVPVIPNYDVEAKILVEQTEGITPDQIPQILAPMRDARSKVLGMLDENKAAMLDDIVQADSANRKASIQSRVKGNLIAIAKDSNWGPYYASAMLSNDSSKDLRNKIRGYISTQQSERANAINDMTLYEEEVATSLRLLQNAGALKRRSAAERYRAAVHSYYTQMTKIDRLSALGEVLTEVERQLARLHSDFFSKFDRVMRELQSTFKNNLIQLGDIKPDTTGYAMRIVSIEEMKDVLDATVANMNIGRQLSDLITILIEQPEQWIDNDENKISALVTQHFLNTLGNYTSRSMIDYIREKYGNPDPAVLQKRVESEIMEPIGINSTPLFWIGKGYQFNTNFSNGYLSIPKESQEIIDAASHFVGAQNDLKVRTSYSDDRISIFRLLVGVPLFGYKGVDNYKGAYKASKTNGIHIYEGAVDDPRDSRKIVDIAPISVRSESEWTEEEKVLVEEYNRAIDEGIIITETVGNSTEYRMNRFDKDKLTAFLERAESVIKSKNLIDAKELLSEPKESVFRPSIVIRNDGAKDKEEIVVRDHIISSEKYKGLMRSQLSLKDKYDEAIRKLDSMVGNTEAYNDAVPSFANALMTGVIMKRGPYDYVAVHEEYGVVDEIQLTSVDSEPYGMDLPLYSAFQAYLSLSNEKKEQIKDDSRNRLRDAGEKVEAAMLSVDKDLNEEKVGAMVSMARSLYPVESDQITDFIKRMVQAYRNFKATR